MSLPSLLANILLDGIENIHSCVRFGNHIAFFLNPYDSENSILERLNIFRDYTGITDNPMKVSVRTLSEGIDFCGWNFSLSPEGYFISGPSFEEYQSFTKTIKRIVNNSNYGAVRVYINN